MPLKIDTIPDFNLIKCSVDKNTFANPEGNLHELINLNYAITIRKTEHGKSPNNFGNPGICFNLSKGTEYWIYERTEEGIALRDVDFERIIKLCRL